MWCRPRPLSPSIFDSQNYDKWKTFIKLLLDNLTDLHQTLHVASVDPPDKSYQNNFNNAQNIKQQVPAQTWISWPNTVRLTLLVIVLHGLLCVCAKFGANRPIDDAFMAKWQKKKKKNCCEGPFIAACSFDIILAFLDCQVGARRCNGHATGCHYLPMPLGGSRCLLLIKWMALMWLSNNSRLSKLFPKLSKGHLLGCEVTGNEVWIDKVVQNEG